MKMKNLKPQQAAPVQREINTTPPESGTGMTPHFKGNPIVNPFAGDDAE